MSSYVTGLSHAFGSYFCELRRTVRICVQRNGLETHRNDVAEYVIVVVVDGRLIIFLRIRGQAGERWRSVLTNTTHESENEKVRTVHA